MASSSVTSAGQQVPQFHSSQASTTACTSKRNGPSNAIDTLTATMQSSRVEDHSYSSGSQIEPEHFKTLLLVHDTSTEESIPSASSSSAPTSSSSEMPPLRVLLHNRIWTNGGELVMILGMPKPSQHAIDMTTTMPAGKKLEGVECVPVEFSADELQTAIYNIQQACSEAACDAVLLCKSSGGNEGSQYAYLMLRRVPAGAQELLELRVAVIGNVDAGKSSTLGVLTRGGLDDGRGKARVNLFRHKHEIESGRTSSVGMEIMGFDIKGDVVMNVDKRSATEPGRKMSWEEVCEKSAKVISFIDLAGHERYLKTTVGGLTGCLPDFVMLMVGANAGLIGMSKEHLGVALALALPVLVCITKIDMTPPHILEATVKQLTKILRSPGCRKVPVFVESQEQAVEAALRLGSERICPIFQISNVTGENLNLLRSFLNVLPQANVAKFSPEAPFKFQLQDVFSVPFVGCVVSGVILSGVVRVGDNLMIGPDSLGQFVNTSVRSIQRKRVNVDSAVAGQSASFALKKIRRNQVRKGMVMLSKTDHPPKAFLTCDAEILCLYHSTTLSIGSCMVLHAASIRQTVKIIQIAKLDSHGDVIASSEQRQQQDGGLARTRSESEKPVVRTGDRALLRLQFIRTAEYLEPGLKLITREGKTKLIGVIRRCGETGDLSSSYARTASSSTEGSREGPANNNTGVVAAMPAAATATTSG